MTGEAANTDENVQGLKNRLPHLSCDQPSEKAMPVILATPDEIETCLRAPAEEALKQRPLPDGMLRIVARGEKEDSASG
jgi:hypothetical protein